MHIVMFKLPLSLKFYKWVCLQTSYKMQDIIIITKNVQCKTIIFSYTVYTILTSSTSSGVCT
jgi:hypothetical protein